MLIVNMNTILCPPNCIDIQNSVRGIYIRTNLTSASTLDTLTGSYSGILARIPIKVQSGGVVFLKPDDATHKAVVKLQHIKTITFRITDDRNRLLDFNGLNLQLAIQFDFVYSKKAIEPLTSIESRLIQHTDDRHLLKDNKQELKKYPRPCPPQIRRFLAPLNAFQIPAP